MDVSTTITPRSDQLNSDHLIGGPQTVTIVEDRPGTAEQPVELVLAEYGPKQPYKPGLSMRRVLVALWGKDSAAYVGRRLTLYRDESIQFGGQPAPGIRISHASDIDKAIVIRLTATRGQRKPFKVEPLLDATPQRDWLAEMQLAGEDASALNTLGHAAKRAGANEDVLGQIRAAMQAAQGTK